jgi:DNA-binding NtrC family response regulator
MNPQDLVDRIKRDTEELKVRALKSTDRFRNPDNTLKTHAEIEKAYLLEVFEHTGGHMERARDIIGTSHGWLYRRIEEYGIAGNIAAYRSARMARSGQLV